jgi:hypothetical protein
MVGLHEAHLLRLPRARGYMPSQPVLIFSTGTNAWLPSNRGFFIGKPANFVASARGTAPNVGVALGHRGFLVSTW